MTTEPPPSHSPEFEREALSTLRFFRSTLSLALVIVGLIVVVSVLGALLSMRSSRGAGAGVDVHEPLATGAVAETATQSGRDVKVTVQSLAQAEGPVMEVKVDGVIPTAGPWTFVLTDGTVLPLEVKSTVSNTWRVRLPQGTSLSGTLRFVHFNPDDSRGDIYFDVAN